MNHLTCTRISRLMFLVVAVAAGFFPDLCSSDLSEDALASVVGEELAAFLPTTDPQSPSGEPGVVEVSGTTHALVVSDGPRVMAQAGPATGLQASDGPRAWALALPTLRRGAPRRAVPMSRVMLLGSVGRSSAGLPQQLPPRLSLRADPRKAPRAPA